MEEVWRDIEGYEGDYKISNLGRVMFLHYNRKGNGKGKIVIRDSPSLCNKRHGYCRIHTKEGEIRIHRAVARAFPEICGSWFEGCVVHHIDGNKENNIATNLIVITEDEHQEIHSNDGVTYTKVSAALKGKPKTKEAIAKSIKNRRRGYKGVNNPFYGKRHTDETREKIRQAKLGRTMSPEARAKMSDSSTRKRGVVAYKDGVKVKEFASIKEGADFFGLYPQNINQVLKGRCMRCGGYEWSYID